MLTSPARLLILSTRFKINHTINYVLPETAVVPSTKGFAMNTKEVILHRISFRTLFFFCCARAYSIESSIVRETHIHEAHEAKQDGGIKAKHLTRRALILSTSSSIFLNKKA